jgi:hypothetical protein
MGDANGRVDELEVAIFRKVGMMVRAKNRLNIVLGSRRSLRST